jgi:CheY-like chemotaxis protein
MSGLDPDILAAFEPEFRQGAARIAQATEGHAAARLIANMRAMVEAIGMPALLVPLDAATAATDPFDQAALGRASAEMIAALDALVKHGPSVAVVRTLLVDDSMMMRRLLRESLASDPAFTIVGEASDGAEALALCAELTPDLVLLDIEMPRMDGVTMLRHWSLQGHGAVLIVSSATQPGSALSREVRRLGAAAIVGKPSGALSTDLAARRGAAVLAAARRAAGLSADPPP